MSPNKNINTQQLQTLLADHAKVKSIEAEAFLDAVVRVIIAHLRKNEEVHVAGLGTFRVVAVQQGLNKRIVFSPDEIFKDNINAPFQCFEPIVIGNVADNAGQMVIPDTKMVTEDFNQEAVTPLVAIGETPDEASMSPQDSVKTDLEQPISAVERSHRSRYLWSAFVLVSICLIGCLLRNRVAHKPQPDAPLTTFDTISAVADRARQDTVITTGSDSIVTSAAISAASDTIPIEVSDSLIPAIPPAVAPTTVTAPPMPDRQKTIHAIALDSMRMLLKDEAGHFVTAELAPGERLTLLASRLYGNKVFWSYIYEVNKGRLKTPNNVPTGQKLYLPDPGYWKIDASDAGSVQRAAQLGAELLQ